MLTNLLDSLGRLGHACDFTAELEISKSSKTPRGIKRHLSVIRWRCSPRSIADLEATEGPLDTPALHAIPRSVFIPILQPLDRQEPHPQHIPWTPVSQTPRSHPVDGPSLLTSKAKALSLLEVYAPSLRNSICFWLILTSPLVRYSSSRLPNQIVIRSCRAVRPHSAYNRPLP